jgi:TnpA family transposase
VVHLCAVVKRYPARDYLSDVEMRKEIDKGLQVVENWNSANADSFYGKEGGRVQPRAHNIITI